MDARILLNLIDDLLREEDLADLGKKLDEMVNLIKQARQNGTSTQESIGKLKSEIEDICKDSVLNDLTPSQLKIAKKIGADDFFGDFLKYGLRDIFEGNQFELQKLEQELEELSKKRKKFIDRLKSTQDNLEELGIKAHYFTDENKNDDIYEIGISLPDNDSFNSVKFLNQHLKSWDHAFKTFSELTGQRVSDTKISRVNNGSIEIFFQQAFEIAEIVGGVILKIAGLYNLIKGIKGHVDGLKKIGVPDFDEKKILDYEKEVIEKNIDDLAKEIIEKNKKTVPSDRINELSKAVKDSIKFIARSIDKGIEVEVIAPYFIPLEPSKEPIDTPEKQKLEDKKRIEKEKNKERVELISKSGSAIKNIGEIGKDLLKLLSDGEENDGEENNQP